jgi:hypothetical protein
MIGPLLRQKARGLGGENPAPPSEIEFVAYAADCRLTGTVRLREARLSDMLNRHAEFVLSNVTATSLVGASLVQLPEITLWRDDLYAVHLAGPRGDRDKKRATVPVPLGIKLGPYLVRGQIHAQPGADPIETFRRSRQPMVPLTEAWIEFDDGGDEATRLNVPALAVNRLLCDWVVRSPDEEAPVNPAPIGHTPPEAATRGGSPPG